MSNPNAQGPTPNAQRQSRRLFWLTAPALLSLAGSLSAAPPKPAEVSNPEITAAEVRAHAPLVFAGYGINRPDLGYDDYKDLDVRGRVVLVLRHTPDGDDNGKFGNDAILTKKTMTAREKGAAGILLLTGPATENAEDL